jgi:TP901 family phage tail tape measure protein
VAASKDLALRLLISARDTASGVLHAITGRVAQFGAAIAAFMGARSLASYLADAVGAAADLQQQLTVLAQVSGANSEELAKLAQAAEDVAASPLPYTAAQAAAAEIELAKAGLSAQSVIAALAPTMSLASAAQMQVGEAAGVVTRALAGFGLAADQAGRVADTLAAGANASNTSVQGLAEALSYAAPAAKAAGYSLEQVTAMIGVLADRGIDASRAGTAINSILSQMQDPASQAAMALRDAGASTSDLAAMLDRLEDGGAAAERAINAFGLEAGPALRALLSAGADGLAELQQRLEGSRGAATAAAEAIQDNLRGALDGLGSLWETIKTRLGAGLLGPLGREIRHISERLGEWIASGQLERLRDSLVTTFESAATAVRRWTGDFDLTALGRRIEEWATSIGATFDAWSDRASVAFERVSRGILAVGDIFRRVGAGIEAVWGTVMAPINLAAAGLAGLSSGFVSASAYIARGAASVGIASRGAADSLLAMTDSLGSTARQNLTAAAGRFDQVVGALGRMVAPAKAAGEAAGAAAQKAAEAAQADESWRLDMERLNSELALSGVLVTEKMNATAAEAAATRDAGAAAEAASAQRASEAAAMRDQIAAMQEQTEIRSSELAAAQRSVQITIDEGAHRATVLTNLAAEARARNDLTAARAIDLQAERAQIDTATQVAAATQTQADAAQEYADTLERLATISQDNTATTAAKIAAAQDSATALSLAAAAAAEVARHQRALADATTDADRAFTTLGITSQHSLEAMADQARDAYQTIRDSANTTENDRIAAVRAYAQAAIKSADEVRISEAAVAAQIEGQTDLYRDLISSTDEAADRLVEAMRRAGIEGVDSMESLRSAIAAASTAPELQELANGLRAAIGAGVDKAAELSSELDTVNKKIKDIGSNKKYTYLLEPQRLAEQFRDYPQRDRLRALEEYLRAWQDGKILRGQIEAVERIWAEDKQSQRDEDRRSVTVRFEFPGRPTVTAQVPATQEQDLLSGLEQISNASR